MSRGGSFDVHQSWGEAAECGSALQGTCSGAKLNQFQCQQRPFNLDIDNLQSRAYHCG